MTYSFSPHLRTRPHLTHPPARYGNVRNTGNAILSNSAADHNPAAISANGVNRGRSVLYCFTSMRPADALSISANAF
jgi:hypothetical protein